MRVALWSDCHNFPSLPLMKLSAYHKAHGDTVEHLMPMSHYDVVYASKVFSNTMDIEDLCVPQADQLIKGGSGYCISVEHGKEVFDKSENHPLPHEIEHIYPDYSLYPQYDFATGFLTRGCPRGCEFCIVGEKEGRCSYQVADITEFWHGQKLIKLLDPNILACRDHESILQSLIESRAKVDFTQGLDIRLTTKDNIILLNQLKTPTLHFAWDNPKDDLTDYFVRFKHQSDIQDYRRLKVYVLTNFGSTLDEDLFRINTLVQLGFDPYVMIYQKETAPQDIRHLQRWCNNKFIFRSTGFDGYNGRGSE